MHDEVHHPWPPAHLHAMALRTQREAVFGKERAHTDINELASQNSVEAFINTVNTLCEEVMPVPLEGGRSRLFLRRGRNSLVLVSQNGHIDHDNTDRRLVTAFAFKEEHAFLKPQGMPLGRYVVRESMTVDTSYRRAQVIKSFTTSLVLGHQAERSAIKSATEAEVNEALDIITALVYAIDLRKATLHENY